MNGFESVHHYYDGQLIASLVNGLIAVAFILTIKLSKIKLDISLSYKVLFVFLSVILLVFNCLITSSLNQNWLFFLNIVLQLINLTFFLSANALSCFSNRFFIHTAIGYWLLLVILIITYQKSDWVKYSFDNVVILSNYLTFIAACVFSLNYSDKYLPKWVVLLLWGINVLLCISVGARASIVALIFMPAAMFLATEKRKTVKLSVAFISLCGLICIVSLFKTNSSLGRLFILKNTGNIIRQHALKGVGLNRFPGFYNLEQAAYFRSGQGTYTQKYLADTVYTSNNEFLQLTAETGVIAMIISVFFFTIAYQEIRTNNNGISTSRLIWYIAVLVLSLSSYPLRNFMFGNALLTFWVLEHNPRKITLKAVTSGVYVYATAVLLVALLSVQLAQLAVRSEWKRVDDNEEIGDDIFRKYNAIYSKIYYDETFLLQYFHLAKLDSDEGKPGELINKLISNKYSITYLIYRAEVEASHKLNREAINTLHDAINISPYKFIPRYALVKLLISNHDLPAAQKEAQIVLNLPVKVPSARVDTIKDHCRRILNSRLSP
ncbi:hypothetical protein ABZR88_14925 [Mucilaginibacter yixingensis]|nr:hypothetical protein [Mucilaginibacter yixingensis]